MPVVIVLFVGLIAVYFLNDNEEAEQSPDEPDSTSDDESDGEQVSADTGLIQKEAWRNGESFQTLLKPIDSDGHYLRPDAADSFVQMRADCLTATGQDIPVSTAYRDNDYQTQLYIADPIHAAKPGYSNHQAGVALDLNGLDSTKSNYNRTREQWITENCEKYGWSRTGLKFKAVEPWHLDYTR